MSSKAELKRIRVSVDRERLRHKAAALQFDKDRRALAREREAVVLALRELCAVHGDNTWTDETPLPRVITEYLGVPMTRRVTDLSSKLAQAAGAMASQRPATAHPSTAAYVATARASRPAPLRPTPLPEAVHRCLVVRAEHRGQRGFRATCVCGWRSMLEPSEPVALEAGSVHVDRVTAARRGASSGG